MTRKNEASNHRYRLKLSKSIGLVAGGLVFALIFLSRMIMIPATLATSCNFMLPVATPPNVIVFSSGKIEIATMAKYGFVLNLFGIALLTIFTMLFMNP